MGTKSESVLSIDKGPDARERILSAAESLFAVRGFEGVSTTQIAKVAGITQPLIHYHFKNKEALWKCTVARLFGRMKEEFEADTSRLSTKDGKRYLLEMIRCYVGFLGRNPEFGQFILREGVQSSSRLDWIVENWLQPTMNQFQQVYDRGRTEGWLKDIPFPQFITTITASATNFYALSPLVNALHGIDPSAEDQSLAHSDAVVEMATHAFTGVSSSIQPEVVSA